MTNHNSRYPHFDPSVVRVSSSNSFVSSENVLTHNSNLQRPVLLGITRTEARGKLRLLDDVGDPGL